MFGRKRKQLILGLQEQVAKLEAQTLAYEEELRERDRLDQDLLAVLRRPPAAEVPTEEPFVKYAWPHPKGNGRKHIHRKIEQNRKLTVYDSTDADGDLIFGIHLETHDRRIIDDLADRYGLELVFESEYRDYAREEFGWQPTEVAA